MPFLYDASASAAHPWGIFIKSSDFAGKAVVKIPEIRYDGKVIFTKQAQHLKKIFAAFRSLRENEI